MDILQEDMRSGTDYAQLKSLQMGFRRRAPPGWKTFAHNRRLAGTGMVPTTACKQPRLPACA